METIELIRSESQSFSIPEIRQMLGIGKTESYWILKHKGLKTFTLCGRLRIRKSDFWEWYNSQTRYSIVNGSPPGKFFKEISYSVKELMELLAVSKDTIYTLLKKNVFETIKVDNCTRITKESFERWYSTQERFRTPEDRAEDEKIIGTTYSMPDIARLLGIHINTVYQIVGNEKNQDFFEFVTVAGQRRITISSFDAWYRSQNHYTIQEQKQQEKNNDITAFADEEKIADMEALDMPLAQKVKSVYRVEDIREALGISQKAAYKMVQTGVVHAIRTGKEYLISPDEFARIMERSQDNGNNIAEK